MDWQPETGDEARVFEFLERNQFRYLEGLGDGRGILGMGTVALGEVVAPLVLLDPGQLNGDLPTDVQLAAPVALRELPGTVAERLAGWEAPSDMRVLFVSPPVPLGALPRHLYRPGLTIRCQQSLVRGTAGPALTIGTDGGTGFLTAGHVVPHGAGSIVESLTRRPFRRSRFERLGVVTAQSDPAQTLRQPNFDAAVVKLAGRPVSVSRPARIARLSPYLRSPVLATINGSVSGIADGAIYGALQAYGDPVVWADSWLLLPSGLAAPGDSGAVVTDEARDLLGIIVGGSRLGQATALAAQYVHDMDSLEHHFLAPHHVTLR